jgi:hypothetical protein
VLKEVKESDSACSTETDEEGTGNGKGESSVRVTLPSAPTLALSALSAVSTDTATSAAIGTGTGEIGYKHDGTSRYSSDNEWGADADGVEGKGLDAYGEEPEQERGDSDDDDQINFAVDTPPTPIVPPLPLANKHVEKDREHKRPGSRGARRKMQQHHHRHPRNPLSLQITAPHRRHRARRGKARARTSGRGPSPLPRTNGKGPVISPRSRMKHEPTDDPR